MISLSFIDGSLGSFDLSCPSKTASCLIPMLNESSYYVVAELERDVVTFFLLCVSALLKASLFIVVNVMKING